MGRRSQTRDLAEKKYSFNLSNLQSQDRLFFLGIGIDHYKSDDVLNLNNAVKDIEDIIECLQTEYSLDSENTFLLFNEEAIWNNLFRDLEIVFNEITKIDRFIIYFAGHGGYDVTGFWCGHLFDHETKADRITEADLIKYLWDFDCKNILIIEDRCFGGTSVQTKSLWSKAKSPSHLEQRDLVIKYLSSTYKFQKAKDGAPKTNSPFAKAFLKMLKTNQEDKYIINNFEIQKFIPQAKFDHIFTEGADRDIHLLRKRKDNFVTQEAAWRKLFGEGDSLLDILGLNSYLKYFPNGIYSREAKERMYVLEKLNKSDWKHRLGEVISKLALHLFEYPNSTKAKEALELITKIYSKNNNIIKFINDGNDKEKVELILKGIQWEKEGSFLYQMIEIPGQLLTKLEDYQIIENYEKIYIGEGPVNVDLFNKYSVLVLRQDYYKELGKRVDDDWEIKTSHPATNLTWLDALHFSNWLSAKHNLEPVYHFVGNSLVGKNDYSDGFRLPTEEEWELIARIGNLPESYDYCGSSNPEEIARFNKNSENKLWETGSLASNNLGIFDMSGNAGEWCWDYQPGDYQQVGNTVEYCVKGGNYFSHEEKLKISSKDYYPENQAFLFIGFRLIRTIKKK